MKSPAATKFNVNDIEEELMNEIDIATKMIEEFKDKIP